MGLFDALGWILANPFASFNLQKEIAMHPFSTLATTEPDWAERHAPDDVTSAASDVQIALARRDLAIMLAAPLFLVPAIPAIYAMTRGKASRRGKRHENDERVGVALENASNASSTLVQTMFASPVIAAAYAYIAVQKAETGKIISKGLGDAVQTLLAVSASGPAIQGVSSAVSAFAKKGK